MITTRAKEPTEVSFEKGRTEKVVLSISNGYPSNQHPGVSYLYGKFESKKKKELIHSWLSSKEEALTYKPEVLKKAIMDFLVANEVPELIRETQAEKLKAEIILLYKKNFIDLQDWIERMKFPAF